MNYKLIYNEITQSTNTDARKLIDSGQIHDTTVIRAGYQTMGTGQNQSVWESEKDKNLLFSIIIFPNKLSIERLFYLSRICALSVIDFLKSHIGDEKLKIKWPNDIYVGHQKIAGILINNDIEGAYVKRSVLGMGININQQKFSADIPNPVSLNQITGKIYDLENCLREFMNSFEAKMHLLNTMNFRAVFNEYESNLYLKGVLADFEKPDGEKFRGRIEGVNEDGKLLVITNTGRLSFENKEVAFQITQTAG